MFVVMPVIPESSQDLSVLTSPLRGRPLCLHLPQRVARAAGADCRVVTTEAAVAGLMRENGIPVALVPAGGPRPYREGVRSALRLLAERGELDRDAPPVVANCRYPFLRIETLKACLERLPGNGEAGVATFEPAQPHPLRLVHAYRIEEADLHVFPEAGEAASGILRRFGLAPECGVSAPFFFDWRGMNCWDDGPAAFTATLGAFGSLAALRPEPAPCRALAAGDRVFLRESPTSARRLLPAKTPPDTAVSALRRDSRPLLGLRRDAGADVFSHTGFPGRPSLLRVWPVAGEGLGAGREFPFPEGAWAQRLETGARPPEAYLAVLLSQPDGGSFDHLEHLAGTPLWALDAASGRPLRPGTGQPFCNRQEFPTLEVLDEAVLCGSPRLLCSEEPAWRAVRLREPENVALRTPLDLLWAETFLDGATAQSPLRTRRTATTVPDSGADTLQPGPRPGDRTPAAAWAETAWSCRNLLEMLSRPRGTTVPDLWPARLLADHTAACLRRRNALAVERLREEAPATAPAARSTTRPALLAHLDGSGLPPALRMVTSDRCSALYVCSRAEGRRQALFSKSLVTGRVRELGLDGADYWGAWFDPAEALLYALFFRDPQFRLAGIDVFAADGGHLHREPLGEATYCNPQGLAMPQGNADGLFLLDFPGQRVLELDKRTLARRDVHQLPSGTVPADYRCTDGRLLLAVAAENLLAAQDLRGGRLEILAGGDPLIPTLVERDRTDGRLAVVCVERNPDRVAPLRHWLRTLDAEGNRLSCADMGCRYARSMTLLEEARLAVFVDHHQGVFHHAF